MRNLLFLLLLVVGLDAQAAVEVRLNRISLQPGERGTLQLRITPPAEQCAADLVVTAQEGVFVQAIRLGPAYDSFQLLTAPRGNGRELAALMYRSPTQPFGSDPVILEVDVFAEFAALDITRKVMVTSANISKPNGTLDTSVTLGDGQVTIVVPTATPSPTPTSPPTATPTPTDTETPTSTPTDSPSPTLTATETPVVTPTLTPTYSPTPPPVTFRYTLSAGWNDLSLALDPSSPLTAAQFLAECNLQGGSSRAFARFRRGRWNLYSSAIPVGDFPLMVGEGYLLFAESPSTFDLVGTERSQRPAVQLNPGWTAIGWPMVEGSAPQTAQSLAQQINSQAGQEVVRYVASFERGRWRVYMAGMVLNANVPIQDGQLYFVYTTTGLTFQP